MARPEAKSSGASVSRHMRHTGCELVRAGPSAGGAPSISPLLSMSSAARLETRSGMMGTVVGPVGEAESAGAAESASGERQERERLQNAAARWPKVGCSPDVAGS